MLRLLSYDDEVFICTGKTGLSPLSAWSMLLMKGFLLLGHFQLIDIDIDSMFADCLMRWHFSATGYVVNSQRFCAPRSRVVGTGGI